MNLRNMVSRPDSYFPMSTILLSKNLGIQRFNVNTGISL